MRLLVACGGTGGHIFPALSFLQRLKSRHPELDATIVVTRRKIESRIIPKEYRTICVDFLPITFSFNFKTAIAITKLFIGTIQSLWIILRWRPQVVVGFGGYATFALVFFGHALGSKTVIHEQNVAAGVANTLLARFADRIAVSFNASKEYFKAYSKKTVYTGNPRCLDLSRVQKEEALAYFGLSQNKFTILVTGGSQGASKINRVFLEAASLIQEQNNFQIIHLSGMSDFNQLRDKYKTTNLSFKLFDFLKEMHYAYSAVDLVIARAGATTLGEIILFGLPAILIPYPFAHQHQMVNAKLLTDCGAAILIKDNELSAATLKKVLLDLLRDEQGINRMRKKYAELSAASVGEDLVDLVSSLMG